LFIHCFNVFSFRHELPEGYVAISHVAAQAQKKDPVRMVSCSAPLSSSFESIAEEEEYNDKDSPSKDSRTIGRGKSYISSDHLYKTITSIKRPPL
jgi:hypothetical protein